MRYRQVSDLRRGFHEASRTTEILLRRLSGGGEKKTTEKKLRNFKKGVDKPLNVWYNYDTSVHRRMLFDHLITTLRYIFDTYKINIAFRRAIAAGGAEQHQSEVRFAAG